MGCALAHNLEVGVRQAVHQLIEAWSRRSGWQGPEPLAGPAELQGGGDAEDKKRAPFTWVTLYMP